MKKKIIIGIIILSILIFSMITIINIKRQNDEITNNTNTPTNNKQEETLKYNQNETFTEDKTVANITFTNIHCSYDGVYSLLEYTITNNNSKNLQLGEYEIIVKDKDGNILANLAPTLEYELAPSESYDTANAIDIDLTNAFSLELIIAENKEE